MNYHHCKWQILREWTSSDFPCQFFAFAWMYCHTIVFSHILCINYIWALVHKQQHSALLFGILIQDFARLCKSMQDSTKVCKILEILYKIWQVFSHILCINYIWALAHKQQHSALFFDSRFCKILQESARFQKYFTKSDKILEEFVRCYKILKN